MDSVDIDDLINRFSEVTALDADRKQKLVEVFGFIEDTTDSALKILIRLLLAYSDKDNVYGKDSEKLVIVTITENSRVKITVNAPIGYLDIQPNISGGIFVGGNASQQVQFTD